MRKLSNRQALEELRTTGLLTEVHLNASINLREISENDMFGTPVEIKRCELASIEAPFVQFTSHVTIEDCRIGVADFYAGYFLGGLTLNRCQFTSRVSFQHGGHNKDPATVLIVDSTFEYFVNFCDCWYEGPFEVRRCTFKRGTNLLGMGQVYEVQFDVAPIIEETTGKLDVDDDNAA